MTAGPYVDDAPARCGWPGCSLPVVSVSLEDPDALLHVLTFGTPTPDHGPVRPPIFAGTDDWTRAGAVRAARQLPVYMGPASSLPYEPLTVQVSLLGETHPVHVTSCLGGWEDPREAVTELVFVGRAHGTTDGAKLYPCAVRLLPATLTDVDYVIDSDRRAWRVVTVGATVHRGRPLVAEAWRRHVPEQWLRPLR